jgi:hypothetical protein
VAERIRAELDNEQRERFDELKAQMRRGGRRGNRRQRPGPMEEGGMDEGGMPMRRGGERRNRDRREDDEGMPPPEMWHGPGKGPERGGGPPPDGGPEGDD